MDSRGHKQHLIEIKDSAQDFIRTEQFRGFVQDFLQRYDLWQSKLAECQEAAKQNPALIIGKDAEPVEPPQVGWEVEARNEYLLELVDESKPKPKERFKNGDRIIRRRFWRPPLPPNPVELLMPVESFDRLHQKDDNLTPDRPRDAKKGQKERLAAHAFLIAVVCYKLSDGIIGIELPEFLTDDVWDYYAMPGPIHSVQEGCRGDKTRSKLRDALFEVKHACKQEEQGKQQEAIPKTDSIVTHQADVLDIANKVVRLIMDARTRARFTEHIDRFCKMVEGYGQVLQSYADKLKEAEKRWKQEGPKLSLAEYYPQPKGWVETHSWDNPFINVDSRVVFRPAEPVNPMLWLGIFGNASLQRKPEENEKLMCEYVRLAIIHDYELRYSGTSTDTPIIPADYKGKWFRRDEFYKAVWDYYHYPDNEAIAQETLSQLDRAFARVQTHIASEQKKPTMAEYLSELLKLLEGLPRPSIDDAGFQEGCQRIKKHIGDKKQFIDTLRYCQSEYKCHNERTNNAIEMVASAIRVGTFPYPALWMELTNTEFISELKRWIKEVSEQKKDTGTQAEIVKTTKQPNLKNPVSCKDVGEIVHKRSDSIARSIKNAGYSVEKINDVYYCNSEDAAVLFSKWKRHLKEQQQNE